MRGVGQGLRPAVIDDDDVDLFARCGTPVERGVGRYGLPGGRAGQQAGEDGERPVVGDHLFESHDGDVQVGERSAEVRVALVGADGERPGFRHSEIDASHGDVGAEEFGAQVNPGLVREVGRVAVAGFGMPHFFEEGADLFTADGDRGQHDVAGRLVQQLHDALPQVAFDGIDAALEQIGRQSALLRQHRLALDEVLAAVSRYELPDRAVHLVGIRSPVDDDAVGGGVAFELFEVMGQVAQRVAFDLRRSFP